MTVYSPNEPDRRPKRDDTRESDERSGETAEAQKTMADASHTNPVTGEPFGESLAYSRGRVVIADGGEAGAVEADEDEASEESDHESKASADKDDQTIGDIDHTPREDAPDASRVYERGGEGAVEGPEQERAAEEVVAEEDEE